MLRRMTGRFEHIIAMRYLRGAQGTGEDRRFLRLITLVAIGGVALGVAALVLAFSIVRGFSREIENKIIGFGAHVQVESFRDAPLDGVEALTAGLVEVDGVLEVDPVIQEFVLLRRSSSLVQGVSIWGAGRLPSYIKNSIEDGSGDLSIQADGTIPVVVGKRLAQLLDAEPGTRLTAFSVRDERGRVRVKPLQVAGIYETDLADFDEIYAFVPIAVARDLFSYGADQVTRLDLTILAPEEADRVAGVIEEDYPFPVMARSVYEIYRSLFAWVRLQESIIPLIISVIVLVAAFNVIGTLLMIILEKTREIGVLLGMGASQDAIRRSFLWLGLLIGASGVILGEVLALAFAFAQLRFGIIPLPAEAYFMSRAPIALHAADFVIVACVTLILSGLSAYLPARFAARIQPVRAIHFR